MVTVVVVVVRGIEAVEKMVTVSFYGWYQSRDPTKVREDGGLQQLPIY